MLAYFKRIQQRNGKLFPGGLSWVNRAGVVRLSTLRPAPGDFAHVSDRSYFRAAVRTGQPFVSEGLTARLSHKQVFVEAVPTRDATGAINGVVTGTLQVAPNRGSKATLDLGFAGLAIVDRLKRAIVVGLVRPARLLAPERFAARQGVISDTDGLNGESGHVLAFAHSSVPQWTVILDRPRSAVFAAARRTLFLKSALLGGVALLDLALLGWIFARARSEARAARERALRRTLRYQQEHDVAVTLQRSLLADVPPIEAVDSAARYQAGSTGLEVGGDSFDVLRRPDGIVQITVGDVAGQGVSAAALMGRLPQRLPGVRLRAHVAAGDPQPHVPSHWATTTWRPRSASRSIRPRARSRTHPRAIRRRSSATTNPAASCSSTAPRRLRSARPTQRSCARPGCRFPGARRSWRTPTA